jgi:benzodiazapine receptor
VRNELAYPGQLRASLWRWALVLAPGLLLLGVLSGAFAGSGAGNPWFAALEKPPLYPPPALFGIAWSVLYVLMGLALAMIVTARGARTRRAALIAFAIQFALNLVWSPLFFAAHQITLALIVLAVLDFAVVLTIILFHAVRPVAALILLPYLAWILFATVLNWQFLTYNPGADGQENSGAVTRVQL